VSRSKRDKTEMSQSWVKPATGSRAQEQAVPAKVIGVMAMTTLLTFATLMTGYQMLFTQSVFA
jgi:hypothetical protein